MDAQLAQKVSQLAHALKESGAVSDRKEAYEMALELLEKKTGVAKDSAKEPGMAPDKPGMAPDNKPDNNMNIGGKKDGDIIFLGKDSLGFEFKGKTLKELAREKQK